MMRSRAVAPLVCWLALAACDPVGLGESNPNFLVVGHRGAPNIAAENTTPSLEAALAVGANAVEIDLAVTEDDVIVLMHDRDPDDAVALARQSGAEGLGWVPFVPPLDSVWRRPVSQLTLAELREHYGYRQADGNRDPDAQIPTLTEVVDWARSEPTLRAVYLDLKFAPGVAREAEAARRLLIALWDARQTDAVLGTIRFFFLSVHREIVDVLAADIDQLGAAGGPFRVVWDQEEPGALSDTLRARLRDVSTGLTPAFSWHSFKREIADIVEAREDGTIDSVTVWTFDREMQLAELLYYSVDAVMTNEPRVLHRMWRDTLD